MTEPICPGCWVILHPTRPPELPRVTADEDCCVCGDPTASGLRADPVQARAAAEAEQMKEAGHGA